MTFFYKALTAYATKLTGLTETHTKSREPCIYLRWNLLFSQNNLRCFTMFWIHLWNWLVFPLSCNCWSVHSPSYCLKDEPNLSLKYKQPRCFERWTCVCARLEVIWQLWWKCQHCSGKAARGLFPTTLSQNKFWALFDSYRSFFSICLEREFHLNDNSWLQNHTCIHMV